MAQMAALRKVSVLCRGARRTLRGPAVERKASALVQTSTSGKKAREDQEVTTTNTIVKRTGLSSRQIDHWARQGYLRTDPSWEGGTGRPREFMEGELSVALRMRDLLECGMSLSAAAKLARGDKDLMMRLEMTLSAVRFATNRFVTVSP